MFILILLFILSPPTYYWKYVGAMPYDTCPWGSDEWRQKTIQFFENLPSRYQEVGDYMVTIVSASSFPEPQPGITVEIVDVPRGSVFEGMLFGSRTSKPFNIWQGKVVCDWQKFSSLKAYQVTVEYGDSIYFFYQFVPCGNWAWKSPEAKPKMPAEIKPETLTVPPLPEIKPVEILVPPQVEKPFAWVQNGVFWLTYEYVHPPSSRDQHNVFSGVEVIVRRNYGGIGLVTRVVGSVLDRARDFGGRVGLRIPIIRFKYGGLDLEAGGLYRRREYIYKVFQPVEGGLKWWEERAGYGDEGYYLRLLAFSLASSYGEFEYVIQPREREIIGGSVTIEPNIFYFSGSYKKEVVEEKQFPRTFRLSSSFYSKDLKAGLKFKIKSSEWIWYVGFYRWAFRSSVWNIDWKGPALGHELRLGRWAVIGEIMLFSRKDNEGPSQSELRVRTGLVLKW